MSDKGKKGAAALILVLLPLMILTLAATNHPGSNRTTRTVKLAITGNVSGASVSSDMIGGCLYAYDIKCTDDDAITFVPYSHLGSPMDGAGVTTTGAIAGEVGYFTFCAPINGKMTYDVTGYTDSVGCTVELTAWEK